MEVFCMKRTGLSQIRWHHLMFTNKGGVWQPWKANICMHRKEKNPKASTVGLIFGRRKRRKRWGRKKLLVVLCKEGERSGGYSCARKISNWLRKSSIPLNQCSTRTAHTIQLCLLKHKLTFSGPSSPDQDSLKKLCVSRACPSQIPVSHC